MGGTASHTRGTLLLGKQPQWQYVTKTYSKPTVKLYGSKRMASDTQRKQSKSKHAFGFHHGAFTMAYGPSKRRHEPYRQQESKHAFGFHHGTFTMAYGGTSRNNAFSPWRFNESTLGTKQHLFTMALRNVRHFHTQRKGFQYESGAFTMAL